LQLDESTDVSGLAAVLVFVRHLFQNKTEQDLLSKCSAQTSSVSHNLFADLDFQGMRQQNLNYHYTHVSPDIRIQLSTSLRTRKDFVGRINNAILRTRRR
jgi:hypothetical protein